jgi:hypothetical protein
VTSGQVGAQWPWDSSEGSVSHYVFLGLKVCDSHLGRQGGGPRRGTGHAEAVTFALPSLVTSAPGMCTQAQV